MIFKLIIRQSKSNVKPETDKAEPRYKRGFYIWLTVYFRLSNHLAPDTAFPSNPKTLPEDRSTKIYDIFSETSFRLSEDAYGEGELLIRRNLTLVKDQLIPIIQAKEATRQNISLIYKVPAL